MTALWQVLSLFLLMLAGLGAARFRILDERGLKGLNTLVLYFAQPAMIVHKLQQDVTGQLIAELAWVFVLTCATIALAGVIAFSLFVREPAERRSVLTNLAMVSNCGYMGYPVITAALGESALIYAVVFVAAFNLMCWTLGAYFFGGAKAMQPRKLLTNPSLIAIAAGLLLFLTGWRLPDFINNALNMMGSVTTPVAMFVIGARLISLRPAHLTDMKLLLVCALRLIVFPAMILLLFLTPLPPMVVKSVFVCTAMPCAALTAMQSEVFDCDRALASRGVALSTALSMATVPLMLLLLPA
ncbi:MAG: AEC family transporter [Clostridiales bacterium]|nr:AEC family transporter [Clostridiales bacterium]